VVYEKDEYYLNRKRQPYEMKAFFEKQKKIMKDVLKVQQIFLLPKYIK